MTQKYNGFTLIELSIVLVIIGLMIGGVLVGRDMIISAQVRQVVTQIEAFNVAANTFRGKYKALPGDFAKATDIWGAADPSNTNCMYTTGTGTQTCNGSGDWIVNTANPATLASTFEEFLIWEHLARAGLIPGLYTHIDFSAFTEAQYPASHFGARFSIFYVLPGNTNSFRGTSYMLGAFPGEDTWTNGPLLEPIIARMIDVKIDNGLPDSGIMNPHVDFYGQGNLDCRTTSGSPVQYDVAHPQNVCAVQVKVSF
jgi:prepilin-type N-terminal cleavage/methylation domain-containing protein